MKRNNSQQKSQDREKKEKKSWEKPRVTILKYQETANNAGSGGDFNGRAS
jgi:hypothetical protein